jgi:hypothetical protein
MAITKNAGRQWPSVAEVSFGYADIAAQGTYEAIDLPAGAQVIGGFLEVITPDTGNGTIAVQVGSEVLMAAEDFDAAERSLFTAGSTEVTANDTIDVVVATADLTVGTFRLVALYVIADRATEVNP